MLIKDSELVKEYKHILTILNHYYESNGKYCPPERRDWLESGTKFRTKRLGDYEYTITLLQPKVTFIHIDGIKEEQHKSPPEHPIQSIISFTDLYLQNIELIKIKRQRKIKNLQFIDIT